MPRQKNHARKVRRRSLYGYAAKWMTRPKRKWTNEWRKRMTDEQKAENLYHEHRNAPIWKIMQLENDGALDWRFRPEYVKQRMRQEMKELVKRTRMAEESTRPEVTL